MTQSSLSHVLIDKFSGRFARKAPKKYLGKSWDFLKKLNFSWEFKIF